MIPLTGENHLEIYYLPEELVRIFHDQDHPHDPAVTNWFVANYFPLMHHLYYETMWNALYHPAEREQVMGEDYAAETDGQDKIISEAAKLYRQPIVSLMQKKSNDKT